MPTPKIAGVALGGDESSPLLVVGPALGTGVSTVWSGVASRLAGEMHVIGWNLPGHEGAPMSEPYNLAELAEGVASFVEAVLASRGDHGPYLYAGCGIGGMVGLHLASQHSENLAGVAAVCSPARGKWTESGRSHAAAAQVGHPLSWEERATMVRTSGTPTVVTSSASTWFTPDFLESNAAEVVRLLHGLQNTDAEGYAIACEAITDSDLRPVLHRITIPVLTVAGAEDEVTPLRRAEEVTDGVPRGKFEVLRHAAHLAPVEHPRAVAELLLELWHDAERQAKQAAEAAQASAAEFSPTLDHAHQIGEATRREVMGNAQVDMTVASTTPFTAAFEDHVIKAAWGGIWSRPGLSRRERAIVTITALVTGGHQEQLPTHVRSALRGGLTVDELSEVILQASAFCGLPAAQRAYDVAESVLRDMVSLGELTATEARLQ